YKYGNPRCNRLRRTLTSVVDADVKDIPTNWLTRYQHFQQCQRHFLKRSHKEFVAVTQVESAPEGANDRHIGVN
ncbi:unnamed protein product, partial [Callosobruchus maculatus]